MFLNILGTICLLITPIQRDEEAKKIVSRLFLQLKKTWLSKSGAGRKKWRSSFQILLELHTPPVIVISLGYFWDDKRHQRTWAVLCLLQSQDVDISACSVSVWTKKSCCFPVQSVKAKVTASRSWVSSDQEITSWSRALHHPHLPTCSFHWRAPSTFHWIPFGQN